MSDLEACAVNGREAAPSAEEVVRLLHEGRLKVGDIDLEVRRACVEHLGLEGFSTGEIAQLLGMNERTVRRDREALRRSGAIEPSPGLGDELLGEFERVVMCSAQRLARLARDPEAPPYARLWAEEAIVKNYQRFIQTAHRMGYVEEGRRRLAQKRAESPGEVERFKQRLGSLREMAKGV
ncbi:MAG: HTH domain-containing protein [Phycisphaeraceae bacterium]